MVSFYLLIIILNIWDSLYPLDKQGLLGAWCFTFPKVSKWWSQNSELAAVFLTHPGRGACDLISGFREWIEKRATYSRPGKHAAQPFTDPIPSPIPPR